MKLNFGNVRLGFLKTLRQLALIQSGRLPHRDQASDDGSVSWIAKCGGQGVRSAKNAVDTPSKQFSD